MRSAAMLIGKGEHDAILLPAMVNRHGLIAGATGTGKTVTLQVIAEGLSAIGVPVFMADVKGDLSGIAVAGTASEPIAKRIRELGLADFAYRDFPVTFWDVFGEQGIPARTTVSDMGPLLLARLLDLNETQAGVLALVFRIADDHGLLLLDAKDLRAMLQYVGDNAKSFNTGYGRVSAASIGAIQRGLLALDEQGGDRLFGEPALALDDLLRTASDGRGMVNVLAAERLMRAPKLYSTFLLWLLSELFERLPEVGDREKPKLVFFFDEAHLLFHDAPTALLDKIEQVVRLVRSKGVGVFFVTQSPLDVPQSVLGQLGNRVQHALRAFTPVDQKAVRSAAQTFRKNPKLEVETAITQLAVGEALVSMLDAEGTPGIVERARICPPRSRIGPITTERRREIVQQSALFARYEKMVDRESAYEKLKGRAEGTAAAPQEPGAAPSREGKPTPAGGGAPRDEPLPEAGGGFRLPDWITGASSSGRRSRETPIEAMTKSAARAIGSQIGRQIVRGVLGSILGGKR